LKTAQRSQRVVEHALDQEQLLALRGGRPLEQPQSEDDTAQGVADVVRSGFGEPGNSLHRRGGAAAARRPDLRLTRTHGQVTTVPVKPVQTKSSGHGPVRLLA
jgi:hypothetical protein